MRPPLRYGQGMKPVPRWFVAVCWVLAFVFALSAGLQVNDPDPGIWIPAYLVASILVGVLPLRRHLGFAALVLGFGAVVWAAYLGKQAFGGDVGAGDLFMKMSEKGGLVEVGREAVGVAIMAAGLIGCGTFRALRA